MSERGTEWRDEGGTWRSGKPPKGFVQIEAERWAKPKQTGKTMTDEEKKEEGDGAAKLFEQTSDIRRAQAQLKSEQRETRKRYKKALAVLDSALTSIYDGFEDKQLKLFDEEP